MPVSWKELEEYADDLIANVSGDGEDESTFRAIGNRIYYSAFHRAKELAEQVPDLPPKSSQHQSVHQDLIKRFEAYPAMVITTYGADFYNAVRKVGFQLNALRGHRVKADYYLKENFNKSVFELIVSDFERYKAQVALVQETMEQKSINGA